jgi:hypothetical protein
MIPSITRNDMGRGTKSNIFPIGVKGKISVAITIEIVATNRYFPGRLLKKGLLLRMTSTIIEAEITDSMNHPVLN